MVVYDFKARYQQAPVMMVYVRRHGPVIRIDHVPRRSLPDGCLSPG